MQRAKPSGAITRRSRSGGGLLLGQGDRVQIGESDGDFSRVAG
jgi:hypothetical protein